ncbi:unnamed protein product [Darwinula stevensoni]|uniref:Uncharacterized protein n=1 Tax=Darwinula stevensoni TaxID=69355 RepID=A0A7R9FRT2_9CRUS|nr:unnamed protein product [Darwinula stevensoni]CAG0901588.1 unnamed protein product [Darwinula stevensoni]
MPFLQRPAMSNRLIPPVSLDTRLPSISTMNDLHDRFGTGQVPTKAELKEWIQTGNVERLFHLVLLGHGRYLDSAGRDPSVCHPKARRFLERVPGYLADIEKLRAAVAAGDAEEVTEILDRRRLAASRDADGVILLQKAVQNGFEGVAKYLAHVYPESHRAQDKVTKVLVSLKKSNQKEMSQATERRQTRQRHEADFVTLPRQRGNPWNGPKYSPNVSMATIRLGRRNTPLAEMRTPDRELRRGVHNFPRAAERLRITTPNRPMNPHRKMQPIHSSTQPIGNEDRDSAQPIGNEDEEATQPIDNEDRDSVQPIGNEDEEATQPIDNEDRESTQPIDNQDRESTQPVGNENRDSAQPIGNVDEEATQPMDHEDRESFQPIDNEDRDSTQTDRDERQENELVLAIKKLRALEQAVKHEGAKKLWEILSQAKATIQEVVDADAIPLLVGLLEVDDYQKTHFESLRILRIILAGSSIQAKAVVDARALPQFIRLLESSDELVVEQAVWALGCVFADGPELYEMGVESGAVECLLNISYSNVVIYERLAWTVNNIFCRPHNLSRFVKPALPVIKSLMGLGEEKILMYSLEALMHFTGSGKTRDNIRLVVDFRMNDADFTKSGTEHSSFVLDIVAFMLHRSEEVSSTAVCLAENVSRGGADYVQALIAADILSQVYKMLSEGKARGVRKISIYRMLANVAAGSQSHIREIIHSKVFSLILEVLKDRTEHHSCTKEALSVVWKVVERGDSGTFKLLDLEDIVEALDHLADAPGDVFEIVCNIFATLKTKDRTGTVMESLERTKIMERMQNDPKVVHSNWNSNTVERNCCTNCGNVSGNNCRDCLPIPSDLFACCFGA